MAKVIETMTDMELLDAWEAGCDWLNDIDADVDEEKYELGLKRIMEIEKELKRRGVDYGK